MVTLRGELAHLFLQHTCKQVTTGAADPIRQPCMEVWRQDEGRKGRACHGKHRGTLANSQVIPGLRHEGSPVSDVCRGPGRGNARLRSGKES